MLCTLQGVASLLKKISGQIRSLTGADRTMCEGWVIPGKQLRFGGKNFADDKAFLRTGQKECERLRKDFGLDWDSRLLEIGCGTGRLPIGILSVMGDIAAYAGVDVSETAVNWCKRHIERNHPVFRFLHLNMANARYNPKGKAVRGVLTLPFADKSFDIAYLYSVFSHLSEKDVVQYLAEFKRLLQAGGKVFLTAFVEESVPSFEENPKGYKQNWHGALHCVRFDRNYFESLCKQHGFTVGSMSYATETDGQSAYKLVRE